MTDHPTARGFTLIELMVAVAVMATLLGILLPALGMAREHAASATCQSNLRQWGLALTFHMNENGGEIPRRGQGIQPVERVDRPEDWFNCLAPRVGERPYGQLVADGRCPRVGDQSVFICPSAADPGGTCFLPYAMNMYLSPWIRPRPHRLEEIVRPDRLVFMADAPGPYASTVPSRLSYSVAARHMGRANVVFVDGHVASFPGDYLGCGTGDPLRQDVQWQTGTGGMNQLPVP